MLKSTETNQFIDAMAELRFYMDESERYKKEKETDDSKTKRQKPKASDFESKDPIPRAESVKSKEDDQKEEKEEKANTSAGGTDSGYIDKENEGHKEKENSEEVEADDTQDSQNETDATTYVPAVTHYKRITPAKYMGMPRYKEYDPAAPTVGVEAVKVAIKAMKELQMLQRNHYPYLLVCMRDDGTRTQTKFRTLIQAQEQMEQEMQTYIDQVEPIDINKVIYMDDGIGAHTYTPTPENELNPDGTFRHTSEIDGTLHILREETKRIVYFETQNATARWDIFNTDIADLGDKPDDPEFEEFVRKAIEEAAADKDAAKNKKF